MMVLRPRDVHTTPIHCSSSTTIVSHLLEQTVLSHIYLLIAMVLDFVTLVLTIAGLRQSGVLDPAQNQGTTRPQSVWRLVYEQGVYYFAFTFAANLPIVVSLHPIVY